MPRQVKNFLTDCIIVPWHDTKTGKEYCIAFPAIFETISQYTGLIAKNGKKIFEDDIVKGKVHRKGYGYRDKVLQVIYDLTTAKFALKDEYDFSDIPNACEVVGNIYDNPELLEG